MNLHEKRNSSLLALKILSRERSLPTDVFKTFSARLPNGFLIPHNNPVIGTIIINRLFKTEQRGNTFLENI